MKKLLVTTLLAAAVTGGQAQVKHQSHGYPIDPVPFTSVKVTDSFWGQRLKASREVTIPLAFSKCEETGRYRNFINAAHPSDTIKVGGLAFDDTDVYKTIEGASYLLQTYPDKKLAKYIDSVLVIVANWGGGLAIDRFGYRFIFVWDFIFTVIATAVLIYVYVKWKQLGGMNHYKAPEVE